MKGFTFAMLLLASASISAQTSPQMTPGAPLPPSMVVNHIPIAYDGSSNYLGDDVTQYKGLDLYVRDLPDPVKIWGYANFYTDTILNNLNLTVSLYKCCSSGGWTQYDALAKKTLTVVDVVGITPASESRSGHGMECFLKLKDKKSNAIIYYQYRSKDINTFPFIIMKYLDYQKKTRVGTDILLSEAQITGIGDAKKSEYWKCTDATIGGEYDGVQLTLKNKAGVVKAMPLWRLTGGK